ncbi:helix-hairpin-helix domain-containing protein [Micromonospora sp. NPDC049366]|uniref:helix-hairpin-helix domain-containing protein n=1 Tax=Micromonospora sp. NPDC049366 TaxID=3364271 RepID=UPI0037B36B05
MAWFINQSLLIILAAFLLGLLVGWLVWGNRTSPPAPSAAAQAAPATDGDPRPAAGAEPVTEIALRSTQPPVDRNDELERIEGIGPKMAAALRDAGIRTFAQLAATDNTTRRTAIEAAGLTFAPSLVTWGRQAQLLADGDEVGFAELTARLVAGRDTEAVL